MFFGIIWLNKRLIIGWLKINGDDKLFELYIPSINLKKNVYNIDSYFNDVDYNIELLDDSDFLNNVLYLAGHSGSGNAGYFDNLVYLETGNFIWLSNNKKQYVYVVDDMFYIQKNGSLNVKYTSDGDVLFLITCSLKYIDNQLVIKAKLIYEC